MRDRNMIEVIKWQIINDKIGDHTKSMKELFLCFFSQNLNRWPNQLHLDEYWELGNIIKEDVKGEKDE